jgi:hypothetical protein
MISFHLKLAAIVTDSAMSRRPLKEKQREEEGIVIHLIGDPQTRSAAVSSLCSLQANLRSMSMNIIVHGFLV